MGIIPRATTSKENIQPKGTSTRGSIQQPVSPPIRVQGNSLPTNTHSSENNSTSTLALVFLAVAAAALSAYAIIRSVIQRKNTKDTNDKKDTSKRCLDIKKLLDKKFDELMDLQSKIEDTTKEKAKEKIKETVQGTYMAEILTHIERTKNEYERLKQLYNGCMAEFQDGDITLHKALVSNIPILIDIEKSVVGKKF